jgi:sirohydrochlorin cobaltochelatase
MSHAILIAGHGSRDADGIAEFLDLARQFRAARPEVPMAVAFLEFARPTIQEGIDELAAGGARTIIVLPGVLMAAGHAKNDMASEVRRARQRHPALDIHMGRALDVEPKLLQLCKLRYQEALAGRPAIDPAETFLLLVGRGSSDPDANGSIAKVARFLQEGYPTRWAGCAFSGVTPPAIPEALELTERLGLRRIVVQPYFLFTGILLKRIYEQVAERRRTRPDIDYVATPHLQTHPLLIETFQERAEEALRGQGLMNCSLCQYRVPIVGFEKAVGEPQQPHHHHVQGIHGHVHHMDESRHHHAHHAHATAARDDPEPAAPHIWDRGLVDLLQY